MCANLIKKNQSKKTAFRLNLFEKLRGLKMTIIY